MHKTFFRREFLQGFSLSAAVAVLLSGCSGSSNSNPDLPPPPPPPPVVTGSNGPANQGTFVVHRAGNVVNGKTVFRFETFGNERFWTDAIRLPQGILATNFTPIKALQAGLSVDIEALPLATQQAIAAELATDLSPARAPLLNSVATTVALINANAVIGIAAKDSNGNGTIDVGAGDKAGATCALCHTITDNSVFQMPGGGSIGKRLDGRAAHNLNFGALVALGTNSRAYYPVLQLALTANGGTTLAARRRVLPKLQPKQRSTPTSAIPRSIRSARSTTPSTATAIRCTTRRCSAPT